MPDNSELLLSLVLLLCSSVPVWTDEDQPSIDFLEYLGNLEERNGEWFGPEQMESIDDDELLAESQSEKPADESSESEDTQ